MERMKPILVLHETKEKGHCVFCSLISHHKQEFFKNILDILQLKGLNINVYTRQMSFAVNSYALKFLSLKFC